MVGQKAAPVVARQDEHVGDCAETATMRAEAAAKNFMMGRLLREMRRRGSRPLCHGHVVVADFKGHLGGIDSAVVGTGDTSV